MALKTVQIPEQLADEADRLARSGFNGFRSRAEVVNHALREYFGSRRGVPA